MWSRPDRELLRRIVAVYMGVRAFPDSYRISTRTLLARVQAFYAWLSNPDSDVAVDDPDNGSDPDPDPDDD